MKNFVIDYHGGSGGDFLRVCLWLMLHPEYKDITFDVTEDITTMVRVVDQEDYHRHICSIDKNGKVSPGNNNFGILFDPCCDALRYHYTLHNAEHTKIRPIQQSIIEANSLEEFKNIYRTHIEKEIEGQRARWDTRDPDADYNISIGHDIHSVEANYHILNTRDEIMEEILQGPVHRIGLLAETPLSTAIMLQFSVKKDVIDAFTYDYTQPTHLFNMQKRMMTHKMYKFLAPSETTLISVTDLLDKDILFEKLSEKITGLTKTELYSKMWDKYMFINQIDKVVETAKEYAKHIEI